MTALGQILATFATRAIVALIAAAALFALKLQRSSAE